MAAGTSVTSSRPTSTRLTQASAVQIGWRWPARICSTLEATWLGPSIAARPIATGSECPRPWSTATSCTAMAVMMIAPIANMLVNSR
ncbi:hypothetical protein D3C81_1770030 [compost metagenome]